MDINTLLKIWAALFPILCIIVGWMFNNIQDLRSRVQKIEDVHEIKIEKLEADIQVLNKKVDKLSEDVKTLASNIHKQKNEENALLQATNALIKILNRNEQ